MSCELRWLVSVPASGLHAAAAIDRGLPLAAASLPEALEPPVAALCEYIRAANLPPHAFWRHAVPLSAGIDSSRQLAEVVLRKIVSSARDASLAHDKLAERFNDLARTLRQSLPNLLDELSVRAETLRKQWEAQGAPLLMLVGRETDERLLVGNADVIVVHPALEGGGEAHLLYNSVRIEAVLADPNPELSEVVRLCWMLAQLNNDVPLHSEIIHGDELPLISALAMLPPTLTAAEELELARWDLATLRLALSAWHVRGPEGIDLAEIVSQWWETYSDSRPGWNVALTALSQMIDQELAPLDRA